MFDIENLGSLTKEELVEMIKENQPVSLWEKQINKYVDIENPKEKMINIRKLRNRVAHNKTFTHKNYTELKEELGFMIKKISEATERIVQEHDKNVTLETMAFITDYLNETVHNLNKTVFVSAREAYQSMSGIIDSIQSNDSLKKVAALLRAISESFPKGYLKKIQSLATSFSFYNVDEDNEDIFDNESEDNIDN